MEESSATMEDVFGPVIHAYTRAQALADGVLIDVSKMAAEAGFRVPVAITANLQADINDIPASKSFQDHDGRLWDVLYMGRLAALRGGDESTRHYNLIMHTGRKTYYTVKMMIGPGDNGEAVITLMRPDED